MDQSRDLYLEAALLPDFIETNERAEEAVKTVLGVFVSKLPEDDARYLTDYLPEYLTYENLRGHQQNITAASPEDCAAILSNDLQISEKEARELMHKIIGVAETEIKDKPRNIINHLSSDWRSLFQNV